MENLLFKIEIAGVTEQVERLGQLRDELMQLRKAQSELDKDFKAGTVTKSTYNVETEKISSETRVLNKEIRTAQNTLDAQNKSFKAAEGSMTAMGSELYSLRQKYRDLSEAERENASVGGVMLTRIQSLDSNLKKLDASIGNHQRNVGNYKSAFEGLNGAIAQNVPIVGQFQNALRTVKSGMDSMSEATGKTNAGVLAIGGAIGIATAAFGGLTMIIKDTIKSSDSLQDKWEEMTTGMAFAYDNFLATIASGDWSNFIQNITNAYEAGKQYAQVLDEIAEKQLGLNITQAEDKATMADLTIMMRNRQLSDEQRVKYGNQYLELAKKIANEEVNQAKQQVDANRIMAEQKTGLGEATIKRYFIERSQNSELIKQAQELIDKQNELERLQKLKTPISSTGAGTAGVGQNLQLMANLQAQIDGTSQKVKNMAYVMTGVNKLSEDQQKKISDGYVSLTNARASYSESTIRAQTTVNSLLAQQGDLEFSNQVKSEKAAESLSNRIKAMFDNSANVIEMNNALITQLVRSTVDAQIMAMADGKEKEAAIINDKYEDEKLKIEQIRDERLKLIEKTIKDIQSLPVSTDGEKQKQIDDIQKLENQKVTLHRTANALVEENEKEHTAKLKAIDEKYSKESADKKISEKYGSDVAALQEDYNQKLQLSQQYYSELGTLTKDQSEQQKREELKLTLDLYQKRYDLLYAEIQARKALGNVTKEEYEAQLRELALLYNQVRKIQNQAKPGEEEKDSTWRQSDVNAGVGSGLATMASNLIGENMSAEAALILNKTAELLDNIQGLWLQSQQERIEAELRAETKKLDKLQKQELKDLQQKRKRGLITEEKYEEEKEAIDQKYEAAKLELQKEAFEKNKRLQIANAIMSGAVAVVNALQTTPIWLGILMAVITGALVAVQVANIASQKFTGARGGMIEGKSHAQGGEKYYSDDQDVELEGGEAVINKKSISDDKTYTFTGTPRQIASAINSIDGNGVEFDKGAKEVSLEDIRARYVRGGLISEPFSFISRQTNYDPGITPMKIRFDAGGYMPAPTPRRIISVHESSDILGTAVSETTGRLAEKLVGAINDQKVIVVESDISEMQDKVKKIKIESKW